TVLAGIWLRACNVLGSGCPDIPVRVAVTPVESGLLKPWIQDRAMAGYQVEANVHATLVGLDAEIFKIFVRAIARSDRIKIGYVITRVAERRLVYGIDPNRVAADRQYVIKFCRNPRQVTYSVAVRVEIALWIDLIKDGRLKPFRSRRNFGAQRRNRVNREPKNGWNGPADNY